MQRIYEEIRGKIRSYYPRVFSIVERVISKFRKSTGSQQFDTGIGGINKNINALLDDAVHIYSFNYDHIRVVARDNKFKVLFILQPIVFDKKTLSEYESDYIVNVTSLGWREFPFESNTLKVFWEYYSNKVKEQAFTRDKNIMFADFTPVLNKESRTVFNVRGDWMHINWLG